MKHHTLWTSFGCNPFVCQISNSILQRLQVSEFLRLVGVNHSRNVSRSNELIFVSISLCMCYICHGKPWDIPVIRICSSESSLSECPVKLSAQVMILCIWCGGRNPLQGSRSKSPHSVDFEKLWTDSGLLLFDCCFVLPVSLDFDWNKVWNKGRVKEWKEYLDILQIEESKHKDFAEFIGRIFMFHASATGACSSQ